MPDCQLTQGRHARLFSSAAPKSSSAARVPLLPAAAAALGCAAGSVLGFEGAAPPGLAMATGPASSRAGGSMAGSFEKSGHPLGFAAFQAVQLRAPQSALAAAHSAAWREQELARMSNTFDSQHLCNAGRTGSHTPWQPSPQQQTRRRTLACASAQSRSEAPGTSCRPPVAKSARA